MIEFPHTAPEGYSYCFEEFKKTVTAIWIVNHMPLTYNGGEPTRSIWGFFNHKTKTYHAPINAKTVGDVVNVFKTTPYSAMIPKQNPLIAAFV